MRDRTVPLVAGEVEKVGAQPPAPDHRVAGIAGMTEIGASRDVGNVFCDQIRVSAKAVAGEDKGVAGDDLRAVAPVDADGGDAVALAVKRRRAGVGGNRNVGGCGQQARLQRRAGLFGRRMHPVARMAGIEEIVEDNPLDARMIRQPFDGRGDGVGGEAGEGGVGCIVRLRHQVGEEQVGRVLYADGSLKPRAWRGHEARREGSGACRRLVPLQRQNLAARMMGAEGGGQAAGARADDEGLDACVRARRRAVDDRGRHSASSASAQVITSLIVARSATAPSCTSSRNAAQPSESTMV